MITLFSQISRGLSVKTLLVAGFALMPALASALPITKSLTVNVFNVCNNTGGSCASTGPTGDSYYASWTSKIWEQAGIGVSYNFLGNVNNTTFAGTIDETVFANSTAALWNYTTTQYSLTTSNLYLFLVDAISTGSGVTFGETYSRALGSSVNAIFMGMNSLASYSRVDSFAHEIGHALGLVPGSSAAAYGAHDTVAANLMAYGGIRSIPTSLTQISTNGLSGYDRIPTLDQYGLDEVAIARSSSLLRDILIPEPHSFLLLALGLAGLAGARRRSLPV